MHVGVALRRFGLCGAPGDSTALIRDPRAVLLADLEASRSPHPFADGVLTTDRASELFFAKRSQKTISKSSGHETFQLENHKRIPTTGDIHRQDLAALNERAVNTSRPIEERLTIFWSNHFTVSAVRPQVGMLIGVFEREALRPNFHKPFAELLKAAVLHPAMLRYLDNTASVGTHSVLGRGRASINENLAREVLELHTLGVNGGYSQDDVTAFACALSGWTAGIWDTSGQSSHTFFNERRHEPGRKVFMGKEYADSGPDQAIEMLDDIARHPATARHVIRRLTTHFIGGTVPEGLLSRLISAWNDTNGDLSTVMSTLIQSDEAWSPTFSCIRSPLEFTLSTCRILNIFLPPVSHIHDLAAMGQPVFRATSPKGWPDSDNGWTSPDGIKTRLDWAFKIARTHTVDISLLELAEQAFGPPISSGTRNAIQGAASSRQGLALLLMAPEMQRR